LPVKDRFIVSSSVPSQKFAHAGNYIRDAYGTVEDVSGIWKGNFYGARGYHDGGEAVRQILDPNVPKKFFGSFEDNDIGKLARCHGSTSVLRRIHSERFNIHLAQFGADSSAHRPI
jgi:hypothetical protein